MLFVIFQLGDDRYALDAGQVKEILPLVNIKPMPQLPTSIAGIFNYRGSPVPVVDLSELTLGRAAHRRLSTRIIVVHYPNHHGERRLLGLIAEKAMETARLDIDQFVPTGLSSDRTAYLGPVATDARGLLQWFEVTKLLPSSVRDKLFQEAVKTDAC